MASSVRNTLGLVRMVALLAIAAPLPSAAQVVYSNGVPDNQNGLIINNGFMTANDFSLLSATSLSSFDWYVLRQGSSGPSSISGNFSWEIFANVGGKPGGPALVSGSQTNTTAAKTAYFCCGSSHSYDTYLFSNVSLGGFTLAAGTYWLGIGGFSETAHAPYTAYWASSHGFAGNEAWAFRNGTWNTYHMEGAFTVYGTDVVPEPASLALLGTGLLGLIPAFRRKRNV